MFKTFHLSIRVIAMVIAMVGAYFMWTRTPEASRNLHPDSRTCARCGYSWSVREEHVVWYTESYGLFAICEHCWKQITPKERLPYHVKLFRYSYPTKAHGDEEQQIRNAILGWSNPTNLEVYGLPVIMHMPNDLTEGFWTPAEMNRAREEGWENNMWSGPSLKDLIESVVITNVSAAKKLRI